MGVVESQITSFTIVYSTVYSDADQRKHQSSASLPFVWGIHRGPVNSPHKWPVTQKKFSFDDVIMPKDDQTTGPSSNIWIQLALGPSKLYSAQIIWSWMAWVKSTGSKWQQNAKKVHEAYMGPPTGGPHAGPMNMVLLYTLEHDDTLTWKCRSSLMFIVVNLNRL